MKVRVINIFHKEGSFTKKDTGELVNYDNYEIHAIRDTDDGEVCIIGTLPGKNAPAHIYDFIESTARLDVLAKDGGRYKFESIEDL